MAPYGGVHLEVAFCITLIRRVVPKVDGHGGHGRGNDHFAYLVYHSMSLFIKGFELAAQRTALYFAGVYGKGRVAAYKGAAHIGASAHGGQPQVGFYLAVCPVETFGR